jgi:hypothetical protein
VPNGGVGVIVAIGGRAACQNEGDPNCQQRPTGSSHGSFFNPESHIKPLGSATVVGIVPIVLISQTLLIGSFLCAIRFA